MTQAKIVDENVKDGEFYLPWSAERANELESDIFFTWIPAGSSTTEITENKLFAQIPAVAKGGLVAVDSDMDVLAVSATSPLSDPVGHRQGGSEAGRRLPRQQRESSREAVIPAGPEAPAGGDHR